MNKEEEKRQRARVNQYAFILNYQSEIGKQYVYMDGMKAAGQPAPEDADAEEVGDADAVEVGDGQEEQAGEAETSEALVSELKPIFYNDEEKVRQFLSEINGIPQADITDVVNRWVKQSLISDYGYSRKGTLWRILSKAGLYKKSKQNWNKRVD